MGGGWVGGWMHWRGGSIESRQHPEADLIKLVRSWTGPRHRIIRVRETADLSFKENFSVVLGDFGVSSVIVNHTSERKHHS